MATANKDTKVNFFKKVGQFFTRTGKKIAVSLKEMVAEMKKVTWPTKNALINYTLVVLAFIVVMGIVIFLIDTASAALVQLITK